MTTQIALFLTILVAALVLFSLERFPADVIALATLLVLTITGLLPPVQAFAGFGSDAVIMILGLLILTAALVRTGVVDAVGRFIMHRAGDHPGRLLALLMGATAVLSSAMSNTASTAFFVPVTLNLARRTRTSPSRLLMPLAFASILSSSVTLVSSSTNVVISGLLTQYSLPPIGMFELTLVGLPILVIGLAYILLLGQRLVPDRGSVDDLSEEFAARRYLTEIVVLPESPLDGKTLGESGLGRDLDVLVLRIDHEGQRMLSPRAGHTLSAGDVLLVEALRDELLRVKDTVGVDIKADVTLADPGIQSQDVRLAEAILLPPSPLIGRTLKGVNFRQRYGLQVLGIDRHGQRLLRKLSHIPLRVGDRLLVQGHRASIAAVGQDGTLQLLGTVEHKRPNLGRARWAIALFVGSLVLAALNVLPLPVAVLLGAVVAFISGCITPEEAYREVEWRVLILMGCMLGVGAAMETTGTASFLATQVVGLASDADPVYLLGAFFLLTMALSQPLSNQAAAVVVVPIAIQTAFQLGLDPRTFAIMIAVGASCSFLTPLEPACLMIYGPGRYRFVDFPRVGALLTVLIFLLALFLVPAIWPL